MCSGFWRGRCFGAGRGKLQLICNVVDRKCRTLSDPPLSARLTSPVLLQLGGSNLSWVGLRVQATKATQMVVGAAKQTNGIEGGGRGNMGRGRRWREGDGRVARRERKAVQASVLDLWLKGCHGAFCTAKSFYTHGAWVCVCTLSCDVAYNRIVKKWQELGASEAIEREEGKEGGGGAASQGTGRASRTLTLCACQNDACNDTVQMPTRNPRSLRFQGTRNYNSSNNNKNFFL